MFKILQHTKNNCVEIKSEAHGVYAKLYLNDGASLQELSINSIPLIADLDSLTYEDSYASALLFPFANRIEDGQYQFKKETFQLDINQKEEHNAIHGLVYNKMFSIEEQFADKDSAQLTLAYTYNQPEAGFPFSFHIKLKYIFTKDGLDFNVTVKNTSEIAFPFTIGWHPYFLSHDLDKSVLKFESHEQLNIGDRNIGKHLSKISPIESLDLKQKRFDDCWQIEGDKVIFETPNYKLHLTSSEPNGFLQVYTPPIKNIVAIEPCTGVSNSFNNNIGLRTLDPKAEFDITWFIKLDTH